MNETRICPNCNKEYNDYPAISRKDNITEICSNCGNLEALEELNKSKNDIESRTKLQYGDKIKVEVLCECIIRVNTRLGVTPIVVVLKTDNNTYFWRTTDTNKELQKFKENEKYFIKATITDSYDNRYINYVKIIERKEQ